MKKLEVKSLDELLAKEYPPQRWLVNSLIPCGGLVMLSSAPASYKTWLMLQMAISVAGGEKLFEQFEVRQSGVLIVDEESGERALHERFKKLSAGQQLPIHYLSRIGRRASDEYIKNIIEVCKSKNIGLVMFDSLIRFHSGNENDSVEMAQVMNEFKKITDVGIACLILHHNRKTNFMSGNSGEAMRGSGDLLASCDIHIAISRFKNTVTISQSKNRYREEITPIKVKFKNDEERSWFEFVEQRQTKDEKVARVNALIREVVADNEGINRSELMRRLRQIEPDASVNRINELLTEMLESNVLYTERGERNAIKFHIKKEGEINERS